MKPVSLFFIAIALASGVLLGLFFAPDKPNTVQFTETEDGAAPAAPARDDHSARLQQLEMQIAALQQRIEQLESAQQHVPLQETPPDEETMTGGHFSSIIDTPVSANARVLDPAHLVKAGVDPATAEDIVRRKNEIELRKLELRDRAAREGYLGSSRYMQELQALVDEDLSLRAELGDDAYDRYLYASGQANRVRVAAVIPGSAAEQAGVKAGDLILRYGENRLFGWRELQQATTRGNRDEYISLSVVRDGQETLLWVPRGPLGVRLSMMRVNPEQ